MEMALKTEALTKIYTVGDNEITAVNQVDLTIERGEFVGLVGPSGSGKTTLLAMLAGLLKPTSGRVIIDGQELSQMSQRQQTAFRRENIGFTFQDNNLITFLTVQENVELMLRLNKKFDRPSRQRVFGLLDQLGLADYLDNLPRQLSGGQRQRVAIARALIHDPDLVLADEPTASLDTERAYQVVETFADLIHEQNRAGILVTHDLRMCRAVDRVVQLIDGRLAQEIEAADQIEALASSGQVDD